MGLFGGNYRELCMSKGTLDESEQEIRVQSVDYAELSLVLSESFQYAGTRTRGSAEP